MRHPYYDSVQLIERLHRYFLEVIQLDLDKQGVQDINNVQALILFNIGEEEMTVGELTARGYYLGSNVSYNVKKMAENGYILQERSPHDKRSVRVKLSEKGVKLRASMAASFEKQIGALGGAQFDQAQLTSLNETLKRLERFWASLISYGA